MLPMLYDSLPVVELEADDNQSGDWFTVYQLEVIVSRSCVTGSSTAVNGRRSPGSCTAPRLSALASLQIAA